MSSILINEKEQGNYIKALEVDPPIKALVNRVMVIQLREEETEMKNDAAYAKGATLVAVGNSGLVALKSTNEKEKRNEHTVVKAVVKSVGPLTDKDREPCVKVNDLVYVFPSVFETMLTIDGVDYFSYSERDMVFVATK